MLRKFRDRLTATLEMAGFALFLAIFFAPFMFMVATFEPAWPAISLMFYIFGTLTAWSGERREKIMCVCGIALYATGWVVVPWFGPIIGSFVCVAGFLVWFQAALDAAFGPFTVRTPSVRCILT